MSTSTSQRVPTALDPNDPALRRFDDRTRSLIEKFGVEPPGIQNVAVMASDFLLRTRGPQARWRDLDIDALVESVRELAPPLARLIEHVRPALAAFVTLAEAHEGLELAPPRGDGFILTALPYELGDDPALDWDVPLADVCQCAAPRNRAERRLMARHLRRAHPRR